MTSEHPSGRFGDRARWGVGAALILVVGLLLRWLTTPVIPAERPSTAPPPESGLSARRALGFAPTPRLSTPAPPEPAADTPPSVPPGPPGLPDDGALPNEYVWRFYDRADREAFVRLAVGLGVEVLDESDFGQAVRLRARSADALARLRREGPRPVGEERNYLVAPPDDPHLDRRLPESGYTALGADTRHWLGLDLRSDDLGRGVTVAVLDTAVGYHPALSEGRILRLDRQASDRRGAGALHGTAVASLIGGNGTAGIHGPAPGTRIVSIPVMGPDGQGNSFALAQAIVQAVTLNAQIINLSLGTWGDSALLRDAIAHARDNQVAIVAAVGNHGVNAVAYPARYPGVLAVGGVDAEGRHVYFSNRGPAVDLVAPAYGVFAAGPNDRAAAFSGTSAAAPLVSGALAALLTRHRQLSPPEAVAVLLATADDAGRPGRDEEYGAGVLNLSRALDYRRPGVVDMVAAPPVVIQDPSGETVLYLYAQNRGNTVIPEVRFTVEVDGEARERRYRDVAVGQSVYEDFIIDMSQALTPRHVALKFRAEVVRGGTDRTPENNTRGAILTVHPPAPPPPDPQ